MRSDSRAHCMMNMASVAKNRDSYSRTISRKMNGLATSTYDQPRVVSDLFFVAPGYIEFTDELQESQSRRQGKIDLARTHTWLMNGYMQFDVIGSANCISSRTKICSLGSGVGAFNVFRSGDSRRAVSSSGCWRRPSCALCIPGDNGETARTLRDEVPVRPHFSPLSTAAAIGWELGHVNKSL